MAEPLDDRILARLRAALDAVPVVTPDPRLARYRDARAPARVAILRGPAAAFALGVAATVLALTLAGSSPRPRVWLQDAANSAQHLAETLVMAPEPPRPADTPEPAAVTSPAPPANLAPAAVQHPTARPPATPEQESGTRDVEHHASPAPTSRPTGRPSPSPTENLQRE